MAQLIIVTGPPGSGKSTIGAYLSVELELPLLSKDPIKERLAGSLGVDGLEWSRRLGAATYDLLFDLIASFLESGASLVVDANFHPEFARGRLDPLARVHRTVQVVCGADPGVLARRVRERVDAGQRHPIHHDRDRLVAGELAAAFERDHAIDISSSVVRVDTTDWATVDLAGVLEAVRVAVDAAQA